ncbi:MAG TPA: hypothetical protein PLG17_03645 [Thermodesulfobacteriota bacterium]|nr:hypothetical protein [Deltaproteobacteria bacterium]HNR13624.1 hypothetical protein [Thermodesulfobacteriota bacterium]HNU71084.1 hypothetical protein [Thermodesulfobacteriota bacterium]HOC38227.1 hypothetical protein [Thermodesulfobacteriota bacterium]HQO77585.1 hypothetical protein [Thermodesulfobacteriota bacterium]
MKNTRAVSIHALFSICFIAVLASSSAAFSQDIEPITEDTIYPRISDAKTGADFEAIAAYFRMQADNAQKKIQLHEKMKNAFTYEKVEKGEGKLMQLHCQNLIHSYQNAKQNYEEMAKHYEEKAKGESASSTE